MLALALAYPAVSQGQADLATVPQDLGLDWYYLLVYPLVSTWGPAGVWALLVGLSGLLFVAPWLPPGKQTASRLVAGEDRPVAVVNLDNCNGCGRCADDCPYSAVMMQPRTDGSRYEQEAVVDPDLCVSCGICVGACPTATPFRQASALVPGIDLPDLSALLLRQQIEEASGRLQGDQRVLLFSCDGSNDLQSLDDGQTAVIALRCMAHLPPPFVDFILSRNYADGVYLAGCSSGHCDYRLGAEWTHQRVARERDPRLRERTDRQKLALGWEDPWSQLGSASNRLAAFRAQFSATGALPEPREHAWRRLPLQALAYGLFAVAAGLFSAWPAFSLLQEDEAMLSLSVSHTGQRIGECRTFTQDELNELPPNMRRPSDCPREKHPIRVEFSVDGVVLYAETVQPSGIWNDGSATIYARFPVPAGARTLAIGMNDSGTPDAFDYYFEQQLQLVPGQHLAIRFDPLQQNFKLE
jgi:ferredoxin